MALGFPSVGFELCAPFPVHWLSFARFVAPCPEVTMVILLTGLCGGGKSSVARIVAERRRFLLVTERELFKQRATSLGYRRGRDWLAEVGVEVVVSHARRVTVEIVSGLAVDAMAIVDGAYDRRLPTALVEALPGRPIAIVVFQAEKDVRIRRVSNRLGVDLDAATKEVDFLDELKRQAGVEALAAVAALTIDTTQLTVADSVAIFERWVASRR